MLASTRGMRMATLTFTGLYLLFMLAALGAALSIMGGFYLGTILALFCMGACAYAMQKIFDLMCK
jgi:hypothetical protein